MPERAPDTRPFPDVVPQIVRDRLSLQGVEQLWSHQAEAIERIHGGEHVVVATGTSSGKSLCYQLAIAEALLDDDQATALYLAPTKALGHDQLRAMRALKLPQIRAAALDGDTPTSERDAIRRTANVVISNPDLLHHSLLPGHARWAEFLHRVRFVVVDESHVCRGVFGSHVALILRRLRRLCERYSAQPTFLLASATIGNPAQHASALTGLEVSAVTADGSPRGAMDIALWQPPFIDAKLGIRASLNHEVAKLMASFVGGDAQTLAFARSRKGAEVIALQARDQLGDSPLADGVKAYRAGYLSSERRDLEAELRDGSLRGVAATSALELGIDVSGLDVILLAGYPGTIASFWQRLGRAGRGATPSAGVLIADDDPLDQYLVNEPSELLEREPEDAIVDPSNPYLLEPHLACACHEQPLDDTSAAQWFGDSAPELLAAGLEAGTLRHRGSRYHWVGRRSPSQGVSIRSAGSTSISIVDSDTGELVGDVDHARAQAQVHDGAVYLHQGKRYEVQQLDLEQQVAAVRHRPNGRHITRARTDIDIRVMEQIAKKAWGPIDIRLGQVEVTQQVTGYDVLYPGSATIVDTVLLDMPATSLRTVAVWYSMAPEVLIEAGLVAKRFPGSLHAAEHAAIGLLPLIALCDRWDIGGLSTALHPDTGQPTVFVYDGYPGGAGLAERSFMKLQQHLAATRKAVAGCRCADGCPSCVQSPKCGNGNEPLDKPGAVTLLDLLLSHAG